MSATPAAIRPRGLRQPVVDVIPKMSVVASPAPARGVIATLLICLALFCGSLALVFGLNTAMVDGAYETRSLQITLNDLADEQAILVNQIAESSTTAALTQSATELGLVPAQTIRHIDLGTGVVTEGIATNGR